MKRLITGLLAIALLVGLVGMVTSAWFSDTETSVNRSLDAGTLDVLLSNDNVTWANGVSDTWQSPVGWAPGDPPVTATLYMKNTGDDGAVVARIKGSYLNELNNGTTDAEGKVGGGGVNNVADYIYITTINYTEGGTWQTWNLVGYFATIFGTGPPGTNTLPLTLREFVDTPYSMVFWYGAGAPGASGVDYLRAGGTPVEALRLAFTFDSSADNRYQSDVAQFDVRVTGDDNPAILGIGGGPSHGYGE